MFGGLFINIVCTDLKMKRNKVLNVMTDYILDVRQHCWVIAKRK